MIEKTLQILTEVSKGTKTPEAAQSELLDLFNVSNPLPDCPHCKSKMNIIRPAYTCPECHCHLRG